MHKYTGVHKYTPMSGKQVDYKSTQVHKYKGTQVQMCISTQVHKNTPMSGKQVAYKSTQVHKYKGAQVQKCASTNVQKYTAAQEHTYVR